MNIVLALINFVFGLLNTYFLFNGLPNFRWFSLVAMIACFWVSGWCTALWLASR